MEVKREYAYFSAAIRDGAKLRPQCFFEAFTDGKSCALGAGYEAIAGDLAPYRAQECLDLFPYLERKRQARCPAECGYDYGDIAGGITHLNDDHRWTREAVADWLYAEEEKLGFVTVIETEAHKPQVGFINNVTEAQSGVLTKRF